MFVHDSTLAAAGVTRYPERDSPQAHQYERAVIAVFSEPYELPGKLARKSLYDFGRYPARVRTRYRLAASLPSSTWMLRHPSLGLACG